MRIVTLIEPSEEPVTLLEAKQHARVDIDDDDNLITKYITAARRWCENYCHISFITQTKSIYYNSAELLPYSRYGVLYLPISP